MSRGIYSTRFILNSHPDEGLLYTVPDGKVAVVRDFDAVTLGGTTILLILAINVGDEETAIWGVSQELTATSYTFEWRGRQVLNEGEQIAVAVSSDAEVGLACSGYLFTA